MDLQGNIEKFSLAEIFQFIAASRKTGTLAIQAIGTTSMVYFRAGVVVYAHCSPNKNLLGDILLQNGKISAGELETALKKQQESPGKRIGEIIVEMGIMELAELEKLIKFQVKEMLYNILSVDTGTFKFYENRFPTEETITVSISTENIILEGVRRLDELSRIKDVLPPLDSIIKLAPATDGRKRDIELEAEEWNLLASIDGRCSINQILEKTTMGRLEALSRIKGFMLAGLVTVSDIVADDIPMHSLAAILEKLDKTVDKVISNR
ncbi:MAG: DUF4388 domain-containing protein [candidate division Zixibacteria bacterium]|nr:DUF4388 domain-containing protein [candidate division Zixibacteria bacterium]